MVSPARMLFSHETYVNPPGHPQASSGISPSIIFLRPPTPYAASEWHISSKSECTFSKSPWLSVSTMCDEEGGQWPRGWFQAQGSTARWWSWYQHHAGVLCRGIQSWPSPAAPARAKIKTKEGIYVLALIVEIQEELKLHQALTLKCLLLGSSLHTGPLVQTALCFALWSAIKTMAWLKTGVRLRVQTVISAPPGDFPAVSLPVSPSASHFSYSMLPRDKALYLT